MLVLDGVQYLVEKEVSALCGLSVHWFRKARCTKKSPPYFKLNGKIYYIAQDVESWFKSNMLKVG